MEGLQSRSSQVERDSGGQAAVSTEGSTGSGLQRMGWQAARLRSCSCLPTSASTILPPTPPPPEHYSQTITQPGSPIHQPTCPKPPPDLSMSCRVSNWR